jgi:signal transduction histidine kinase
MKKPIYSGAASINAYKIIFSLFPFLGFYTNPLFSNTISLNKTTEKIPLDEDLVVAGNREALAQILRNLIANAVDAISGPGSVTLTAIRSGTGTVILVTDTGCGISPENIDSISTRSIPRKTREKARTWGLISRKISC